MTDINKALFSLAPTSTFRMHGTTYEDVVWLSDDIPMPSKTEVEAEKTRLQAEYDSKQYQRDRKPEYPAITDQLDMLWHMMDDETIPGKGSVWYNTIKDVKDQFPKAE